MALTPNISTPYDEQIRILRTLEQLQGDHIILLKAIMKEPEGNPPPIAGSFSQTLSPRLQDMGKNRIADLIEQLNDLRITKIDSINTMMTGSGSQDLRHTVTDYGKRFIQYINAG